MFKDLIGTEYYHNMLGKPCIIYPMNKKEELLDDKWNAEGTIIDNKTFDNLDEALEYITYSDVESSESDNEVFIKPFIFVPDNGKYLDVYLVFAKKN